MFWLKCAEPTTDAEKDDISTQNCSSEIVKHTFEQNDNVDGEK